MGSNSRPRRIASGFTLIEVIIAIVIFVVIMAAIEVSIEAAYRAQGRTEQSQEETATVRSVFSAITRDVQAAYGTSNNPSALFQAGTGNGLLTLTTENSAIVAPGVFSDMDPNGAQQANSSMSQQDMQAGMQPQSDTALVRYDYSPVDGTLTRAALNIPNAQAVMQKQSDSSDPKAIIARKLVSLNFRYWDSSQNNWRSNWNFHGKQPDTTATGTNGAAAAAPTTPPTTADGQPSPTQDDGSDSWLPSAIEVEMVVLAKSGEPKTYSTRIPITASKPLTAIQPPTTGTGAGVGTGGAGAQANPQ